MRDLTEIVVHCTATRANWWADRSAQDKVKEVRRWHVAERGWSDIGYHFLIDRDGTVVPGRSLDRIGAHVKGHNRGTIGISLFGGHGGAKDEKFSDNFTPAQDTALRLLIEQLQDDWPTIAKISGHSEYANKACPCFDVTKWLHAQDDHPAEQLFDVNADLEPMSLIQRIISLFRRGS